MNEEAEDLCIYCGAKVVGVRQRCPWCGKKLLLWEDYDRIQKEAKHSDIRERKNIQEDCV